MAQTKTLVRLAPMPRRVNLLGWLLSLVELRHQRGQLAELDAHLLSDIGLTEAAAQKEAHRSFWDAPDHWQQ